MTEPVAYLQLDIHGKEMVHIEKDMNGYETKPLYTAEQLYPRVKMTHSEFEEWKLLYEDTIELSLTAYRILDEIVYSKANIIGKYSELCKRVYQENDFMTISEKQAELTNLFINYSPDNPEETIEILPDMKWFVRSKKQYQPDISQGISESGYLYLTQGGIYSVEYHEMIPFKDEATQFNTEDGAKLWTTPDTEAVQLPVEQDND